MLTGAQITAGNAGQDMTKVANFEVEQTLTENQAWIDKAMERCDRWCQANTTAAGVLFGLVSALAASLHVVGLRGLPKGKNPYQITNHETVCCLLYSLVLAKYTGGEGVYSKDYARVTLFLFRSVFAMPGFTCNVVGTYLLPSQLFIVLNNSNMIFAILIAAVILKVYPPTATWVFVGTFILGVMVMVYPEALGISSGRQIQQKEYELWWIVFPIISGFTGGSVTNLLQIYSGGITLVQNTYWWSLSIALMTAIIFPMAEGYETLGFREYLLIPILGFFIFSSLALYNLSCRYEKRAAVVTSVACSQIVMTYILDVIFSGSPLILLNVIGASIVILSIVGIAWFKSKK